MELDREQILSEIDTKIKYAKFVNTDAVILSSKAAQFCLEHAQFYEQKINELTFELKSMRTAANSYKMHYEKLEAENERLIADKKELINDNAELKNRLQEEIAEEDIDFDDELLKLHIEGIEEAKAYTVRKMQEMFDNRVKDQLSYHGWYLKETIMPSIAKEILNDKD